MMQRRHDHEEKRDGVGGGGSVGLYAGRGSAGDQPGDALPGKRDDRAGGQGAGGAGKVEMAGLPANFDPRTLRVETDAGIQVGEVSVRDVSRTEALGRREAELEERIQKLKDEK